MRGSIQKKVLKLRKKGKPIEQYYIVYDAGKKWDEKKKCWKRNQKWEKVPPPNTYKHAEKLLTERLSQLNKGEYIEPTKITFEEFKDEWIEKYAVGQIRPSSLSKYNRLLRNHIIPVFGSTALAKIEVKDIQGFRSQKSTAGYSPQSVHDMLRLMRQMMDHAIDWGYIRSNPARKVKYPKIPKKEMDFLTPEEIRLFLEHVPEEWYALMLVPIVTGLRIGELLAMKWKNLAWEKKQYFVREQLARRGRTPTERIVELKTEHSKAPVDLPSTAIAALQKHRERQAEGKIKPGVSYQDHDLIFATSKGTPFRDWNVASKIFKPTLRNANLRDIRFHDLRHTCASLLIAQGESPKYIQKQMRHSSIQITFDRYGHLFPDVSQEAMRKLDENLFGEK